MIDPIFPQATPTPAQDKMHRAAQELESGFLAEMLKHAGLGKTQEALGGGAGEEQFASFLVQEQAQQLARHGGIGLPESLFQALERSNRDG